MPHDRVNLIVDGIFSREYTIYGLILRSFLYICMYWDRYRK